MNWTKTKPDIPGTYYWTAGKKRKVYLVEVNWETCDPWLVHPKKILLADTSKIILENQQYYYQLGEWACMEDFTFGYWYGPVEKPKGMR